MAFKGAEGKDFSFCQLFEVGTCCGNEVKVVSISNQTVFAGSEKMK